MNSSTSIILVVACVACMCSLAFAAGIAVFVAQKGGFENAWSSLTGGAAGSGWKLTERNCSTADGKDGVKNSTGKCVPLEVDSPDFGTGGGSYQYKDCPSGEYIDTMAAGYDEGTVFELKWLAASCSGGQFWSRGNSAPSKFTGIDSNVGSVGSGTKYDNRYWKNPANPGWDQVAYVTGITRNGKVDPQKDTRVRAFGPKTGSNGYEMFGVNDNKKKQSDILDGDRKLWRCDKDGYAPAGKRYAITGIGASTGTAVDRFKVKCRMFDTT